MASSLIRRRLNRKTTSTVSPSITWITFAFVRCGRRPGNEAVRSGWTTPEVLLLVHFFLALPRFLYLALREDLL